MITYAIGDLHGMFDMLQLALAKIEEDAPKDQPSKVIFIGDYVDRGPHSKQVIERLIQGPTNPQQEWICLKGNHDFYFANVMLRQQDWNIYANFGCYPTLGKYSYNVVDGTRVNLPFTDPTIIEHAKWIDTLPYMYEDDYRYYVHAGFMPEVPIEEQTVNTMIWIRQPFLISEYNFGKMVIHGHTPTYGHVDMRRNRINIDTGACFRQSLTLAKFVDNEKPIFWQFKYNGPLSVA